MQEEKRKILTKEKLREQLMRSMKVELILVIVLFVFVVGLMAGLTALAYHQMPSLWMIWGALLLLDVGLAILWVLKIFMPIVKGLCYIAPGRFYVVEDKLVGVGEGEVVRRRGAGKYGRYYTIDMLYFEGYGNVPEDKGVRGYGPVGSVFYLVVLEDDQHTIHTFYSSQLYCYKN